jgi:hypothetical protein
MVVPTKVGSAMACRLTPISAKASKLRIRNSVRFPIVKFQAK